MENKSYQIHRDGNSSSPLREIRQVVKDWVARLRPYSQDSEISEHGNHNQNSNNQENENSDAVFIGWQKTPDGDAFPLYNITVKNHPLYRSTVSEQTLRKVNLKIPPTPPQQNFS
ncbi:MAG: hypothetical protein NTX44_02780 [Ignavibacteriales bacterium]|nr:hypothetical protein [Ignavibacteriales bacterium]